MLIASRPSDVRRRKIAVCTGNGENRNPVFEVGQVAVQDADIPLYGNERSRHCRNTGIRARLFLAQAGKARLHLVAKLTELHKHKVAWWLIDHAASVAQRRLRTSFCCI